MHHAGIIWLLVISLPLGLLISCQVRINLTKQFVPGYAASLKQSGGLSRAKAVLEMFEAAGKAAALATRRPVAEEAKANPAMTGVAAP